MASAYTDKDIEALGALRLFSYKGVDFTKGETFENEVSDDVLRAVTRLDLMQHAKQQGGPEMETNQTLQAIPNHTSDVSEYEDAVGSHVNGNEEDDDDHNDDDDATIRTHSSGSSTAGGDITPAQAPSIAKSKQSQSKKLKRKPNKLGEDKADRVPGGKTPINERTTVTKFFDHLKAYLRSREAANDVFQVGQWLCPTATSTQLKDEQNFYTVTCKKLPHQYTIYKARIFEGAAMTMEQNLRAATNGHLDTPQSCAKLIITNYQSFVNWNANHVSKILKHYYDWSWIPEVEVSVGKGYSAQDKASIDAFCAPALRAQLLDHFRLWEAQNFPQHRVVEA